MRYGTKLTEAPTNPANRGDHRERSGVHNRYDRPRAPCHRGHRPDAGDPRDLDPAVRRVSALGDGHLHGPRPGRSEARPPQGAGPGRDRQSRRGDHDDDREGARSDGELVDDPSSGQRPAGAPHARRGPGRGIHHHPQDRSEHGVRRGHLARRPEKGAGALPGHTVTRHDRERRDRRASHDLPAPVLGRRQSEAGRRHHHPDRRRIVRSTR